MRAVFLDKDGTLITDHPYNIDHARIELLPGVVEGLQQLHAAGYALIVVTNQSGVARGLFSEGALAGVEARLRQILLKVGVPLAGFYYCPHHPDGHVAPYAISCGCRKPQPGLLLKAARTHRIDLERSWMIGDILDDVEAGDRAGCGTILIDNGHETEWRLTAQREPHYYAWNLREAAQLIGHQLEYENLEKMLTGNTYKYDSQFTRPHSVVFGT